MKVLAGWRGDCPELLDVELPAWGMAYFLILLSVLLVSSGLTYAYRNWDRIADWWDRITGW